jgi:malate/lactate dehydrogenase
MLGADGVLEILNVPLTETEVKALRHSAKTLDEVQSNIVLGRQ